MWSSIFSQEEEFGRGGTGAGGGKAVMRGIFGKRRAQESELNKSQRGKVKLVFLIALVGVTLAIFGVSTDYWVELAPPKGFYGNETCLVAHYGLWKGCVRRLWLDDIDPNRESCGPAGLPGESNCTYFRFFTLGQNAIIFKRTTTKSLNMTTAVLSLISFFMMAMGCTCIVMALSKGVQFFVKSASFCFIVSGLLLLVALIIFHQSVLSLLGSDQSVPLHHELSSSVACVGSAGAVLIVGGILFVMLFLPGTPCK
ncbi:voltage-dependent calcium channel gamma-6 subunit [Brienomyrus brachyistius]|uniref:voltage-dependent calcium channel gamma-6 subunit n=1 Tax=Brienomyrus brachyistius TaxID=42636 RepID=UPI0020B3AFAE|nr:voltage-dependent calcium channel gamma-6 subunit [Brienomyrus brachyistius]